MTVYVNGLMFSPDLKKLVLIEKQKPDFQKGKLNGVGGKVEGLEDLVYAMIREFEEETGVKTVVSDWRHFLSLCVAHEEKTHVIYFFVCSSEKYSEVRTVEEEKIVIIDAEDYLNYPIMNNLKWIIPMAIDKDRLLADVCEESYRKTVLKQLENEDVMRG